MTKLGKVSIAIFMYYVIAGDILLLVIWTEREVITFFESINQHWFGFILFLTLSYSLNTYLIYVIIMKVKRKEWQTLTTKTITYSIENDYLDTKKFLKIHFNFIYLLKNKIYSKKFKMLQKKEHIPKVRHYLEKNLQDEKAEAIIYYNPQNETQSAFNYGISKLDLVLAPFLVGLLLTMIGSSLYSIRSKVNNLDGLVTPILLLLVFIECLLLISYIPSLFIGKKLAGFHDHTGYPLFYNPLSKVDFDLIKNVREIEQICLNCGGHITQDDQYCSICGTTTLIDDFVNPYSDFSYM